MSLVSRAINVLTQPKAELARASAEPATTKGLVLGYAAPLAALPAVGQLLALLIFAGSMISYMIGTTITSLVLTYLLRDLGLTVLVGVGLAALAPNFGGQRNSVGAMKLAVYAATPIFIAGFISALVSLTPLGGLSILFLLAGFAFAGYIIYLGASPMLGVPTQQAAAVAGITAIAWLILYYVVSLIIANLVLSSAFGVGRYGI